MPTAATRSNLVMLRRRLLQVRKGAALLRRKRESLVAELFDRARPAIEERKAIEQQLLKASRSLLEARANHSSTELAALGWPAREVLVELEPVETFGLSPTVTLTHAPSLVRGLGDRAVAPGRLGDVSAVTAGADFERLIELVLDAAPKELVMRRLGDELARATRVVNTLEQRLAVRLTRELATVRRTLDEREREEQLRLKRVMAKRRPGERAD